MKMPEDGLTPSERLGKKLRYAIDVSWFETVKEACEEIGVPRNSMCLWMSGKRMPNARQLVKLAVGLDVSADWLLGLQGEAPLGREARECADAVERTDPEWRATAADVCEAIALAHPAGKDPID